MLEELKNIGFSIVNGRLTYEFSDFELLKADISEVICADNTKAIKLSNLRVMNPMEDGLCHVMFAYSLYYRNINDFLTMLSLIGYKIKF